MSKAEARLFRDPNAARHAVEALVSAGFNTSDIGVLARDEAVAGAVFGAETKRLALPEAAGMAVGGRLALLASASGANGKLAGALAESLGLAREAAEYYEFALGAGGVLVSVQAAEDRQAEARRILGEADITPPKAGVASPGFYKADRMSATNPVDAAMTGDFRRY
ncbi:MAG: general stress protein [Chloroflexi bacterium]|nr:general stress protein [Chloroflexota bacterium]